MYAGVTAGKALSAAYIQANQEATMKQIVIGGLRLSYVIQSIFGSAAVEEEVAFLQ